MEIGTYYCKWSSQHPTLRQLPTDFWEHGVDFVRADDGRRPNHPTKLRCLWNERQLSIYFNAVDPDIWGTYTRPNDPIYREEVVEAFLAPNPDDLTHYFELELSPRNVPFAARITNNGRPKVDLDWELNWQTEGFVQGTLDLRDDVDEFWLARMLLPVSELSAGLKAGDRWRANFYRIDRTPQDEYSALFPIFATPADFHTPQRFGHLLFTK